MSEPARPRPAATLVILRDTQAGLEVLLTKRPASMRFMGGATVFPGGAVAAADRDPRWRSISRSMESAIPAFRNTTESEALAAAVCALREANEEVGFVFEAVSGLPAQDAWGFLEAMEEAGVTIPTDLMRPAGRWVTPEDSPLRFDTWFFAIASPDGWEPRAETGEVDAAWWCPPQTALRSARDGESTMAPPTFDTLRRLSSFGSVAEALDGFAVIGGTVDPMNATRHSNAITAVLAPNGGVMAGPGTNAYIVGAEPAIVVDPASDDESFIRSVIETARGIEAIVITHRHSDHVGGVAELVRSTGATVRAFGDDDAGGSEVVPVRDGEALRYGEIELIAVHTPGHASDHLCFLLTATRELLAGDNVVGQGTSVIAPPDGDMDAYLDSLQKMKDLSPSRLYPGHFDPLDEPQQVLDSYIAHRLEREGKILDAVRSGAVDLKDIVAIAYSDTPSTLHPIARASALAHLQRLEGLGSVVSTGDEWKLASG